MMGMKKWQVISIALIIVLAGVAAGFFDFSQQINPQLENFPAARKCRKYPFA